VDPVIGASLRDLWQAEQRLSIACAVGGAAVGALGLLLDWPAWASAGLAVTFWLCAAFVFPQGAKPGAPKDEAEAPPLE
jgi:hypothetical protein